MRGNRSSPSPWEKLENPPTTVLRYALDTRHFDLIKHRTVARTKLLWHQTGAHTADTRRIPFTCCSHSCTDTRVYPCPTHAHTHIDRDTFSPAWIQGLMIRHASLSSALPPWVIFYLVTRVSSQSKGAAHQSHTSTLSYPRSSQQRHARKNTQPYPHPSASHLLPTRLLLPIKKIFCSSSCHSYDSGPTRETTAGFASAEAIFSTILPRTHITPQHIVDPIDGKQTVATALKNLRGPQSSPSARTRHSLLVFRHQH